MKKFEILDVLIILLAFAILILSLTLFVQIYLRYGELCGSYATMQRYMQMLEQLKP